jgi:hypothetical protein
MCGEGRQETRERELEAARLGLPHQTDNYILPCRVDAVGCLSILRAICMHRTFCNLSDSLSCLTP